MLLYHFQGAYASIQESRDKSFGLQAKLTDAENSKNISVYFRTSVEHFLQHSNFSDAKSENGNENGLDEVDKFLKSLDESVSSMNTEVSTFSISITYFSVIFSA